MLKLMFETELLFFFRKPCPDKLWIQFPYVRIPTDYRFLRHVNKREF